MSTFIAALNIRQQCNGFPKIDYVMFIDFENKVFKKIDSGHEIKWHKNCYASYISNRNLTFAQLTSTVEVPAVVVDSDSLATRSQSTLFNLKTNCMFCGYKKYRQDNRLITIQYESVLRNVEKRCMELDDFGFKRKIGGDFSRLPALEAKYHSRCYNAYMKKKEVSQTEISVHQICFDMLTNEMDKHLSTGRALNIQDLLSKYKLLLKEENYEGFDAYTTQKLKLRITSHYGSKVCFTNEINQKQFVYNSDVSIANAINVAANYKQMLSDNQLIENSESNVIKILERAAEILKREIKSVDGISIHPLDPADISEVKIDALVPEMFKHFLNILCIGSISKKKKMLSIAQDIISLNSSGKKRMPKNVGLGVSLKNSTRSKEFISYLNSLGHSISYDDVLRIETTWATEVMESGDGYATIPSNISSNIFTQAASDNGDYGQENNSQHVTNTVVYQYTNLNGMFPSINVGRLKKKSTLRRSISLPPTPMEEIRFFKDTVFPTYYSEVNIEELLCGIVSESQSNSGSLTAAWILLRITGNKIFNLDIHQKIPSWTGFRKVFTLKCSQPTVIGNCRSLPASPTDINVVHTMLVNVKKILTNIGQTDPCVTVDESIYQLAKQVQWCTPTLQDITIRLGGFHRAKNFMGVIGKRMQSTGFGDILEAAGLFGANQVEGN